MIEALRGWLTSVIVTAFLLSVAERTVPAGSLWKIASATGGLILLLVLLQPLLEWREVRWLPTYHSYRESIEEQQRNLKGAEIDLLAEEVAERTAVYIQSRALEMGISCRVTVETQLQEDGIPIPWRVIFDCEESPELTTAVERELGIPQERQVYNGAP